MVIWLLCNGLKCVLLVKVKFLINIFDWVIIIFIEFFGVVFGVYGLGKLLLL